MKKRLAADRRRSLRVEKTLSLQLTAPAFDLTTETKNVSRRGVYCRVNRHIPFMAKLKIALLVPLQERGRVVSRTIRCDALVVRSESQMVENGKEKHFVALYFERMKPSDSVHLERYIQAVFAAHPVVYPR